MNARARLWLPKPFPSVCPRFVFVGHSASGSFPGVGDTAGDGEREVGVVTEIFEVSLVYLP
jgi:hypothetical protein